MKYLLLLCCVGLFFTACNNEDLVVDQGVFELKSIENHNSYVGDTVTIWGNNLGDGMNSTINFDSTFAIQSDECILWTSKKVIFEVPSQAFSTDLHISKAGEKSNSLPIQVSSIPMLPLALVQAASFQMGATIGNEDERPIHDVTLSNNLEVSKYEITQRFYELITGENPSSMISSDYPVHNIEWLDAIKFCNLLSDKMGYTAKYLIEGQEVSIIDSATGWRLPTEAEWEFLCRAGNSTDFSGTGRLVDMGWYSANSGMQLQPVGLKQANNFDLYDMHGNVSEWCFDLYASDYYVNSPQTDPTGATEGTERVLRGGNYQSGNVECRSAYRATEVDKKYCGIRIVREVK